MMLNVGEFARLGRVSPRMLRHYHQTGLLLPSQVDPESGYRSYGIEQLGRLHRLVALRDLGFTLEQIRPLLDDELSVDELRGMLRLRRAQIEQCLSDDQTRLRHVEAHLRAMEERQTVQIQNVVIKDTEAVRVAEIVGCLPGFGVENTKPVFVPLFKEALAYLKQHAVRPGINIACYDAPADDGSVMLHVGFDIGAQDLPASERIEVVELAPINVASVIHRGPMEGIADAFDALIAWTKNSGYSLHGTIRELYLEWNEEDDTQHVTELQLPLALDSPTGRPPAQTQAD